MIRVELFLIGRGSPGEGLTKGFLSQRREKEVVFKARNKRPPVEG